MTFSSLSYTLTRNILPHPNPMLYSFVPQIFLSDGIHFLSGMCATQLNPLVHSGIIAQHCVLQVSEFIVNTLGSGKKICILLGCEAAGPNPGDKIGIPVNFEQFPYGAPPAVISSGRDSNNRFRGGGGGGGSSYETMNELTIANTRLNLARFNHEKAYEETIAASDEWENILVVRLAELNTKKEAAANIYGNPDANDDDLVEINAGGKVIVAKRSTLTQIKGTRFEALFSGRWDKKLQRDKHGRIFLDVNPACFRAIVDYLNEVTISCEDNPPSYPTVDRDYDNSLNCHLEMFGLPPKVKLSDHSIIIKDVKHVKPLISTAKHVTRFSADINTAINSKQYCLSRTESEIIQLEDSFNDEENFFMSFALDTTNDLVSLSVSGTTMTTRRSTLCVTEDSVLAQQFDESKWTEQGSNVTRVKNWTLDEVNKWAKSIDGLAEDVSIKLYENEITGRELIALNIDGLKMMGIERVGSLCLILDEIKLLKQKSEEIVTLIEHSPYCFGKILDYLRLTHFHTLCLLDKEPALPKVCALQQHRFEKVVKYYFPGDGCKFILGNKKDEDNLVYNW